MTATDPSAHARSRSTIFAKTAPDFRREIDRAIVNRTPPTYKGVYDNFKLRDRVISFTSFFLYARRVRMLAAAAEYAALAREADPDAPALTPQTTLAWMSERL